MMEPVAWAYSFKSKSPVLTDEKKDWAVGSSKWAEEPLVRLSDAEARIATLEAELETLRNWVDPSVMELTSIKALTARAEAAEALLKEAEADDTSLLGKLKFMRGIYAMQKEEYTSRALHNIITEFEASRAARAIHHKIGAKDE